MEPVAIGLSRETFRLNQSFANPPPESGGSEPVWDSLIPSMNPNTLACSNETVLDRLLDGLGYVKHPDLAPDLSVISAFHQLHCLVSLVGTLDDIH